MFPALSYPDHSIRLTHDLPQIASDLADEKDKRMEAAYDLLHIASNDVFFGTPEEKMIVSKTLATHPSSFMEAVLLLSLKER